MNFRESYEIFENCCEPVRCLQSVFVITDHFVNQNIKSKSSVVYKNGRVHRKKSEWFPNY